MLPQKRAMGQYSTPQDTVAYMVETVLSYTNEHEKNPMILDPSTGDGIFIKALDSKGVPVSRLYAYDIDTTVPSPLDGINFSHQDFLKATEENKYDVIIGNPPYKSIRQSQYFQENKQTLKHQFSSIGIHNMYSLFIYKGIQLLKENGILSMIVQDSFLTNVYYKHFREHLLHHTEIKEIALAPRRLFHKGKADVRTSILTLVKKKTVNPQNEIRLVDRLKEQNYFSPPEDRVQYLSQSSFLKLPAFNFAVNVPNEIHSFFQDSYLPLGAIVKIGTGISTGKDQLFLKHAEDSELSREWVPFYKNGGAKDAWYYPPKFYIEKDWESRQKQYPSYMVRNPSFFFREGITCSSMGAAFSASYMPPGCLFGVNANIFPDQQEDLFYLLGYLNSSLVKYLLRKVLNRTNMITAGYIKKLPYRIPDPELKKKVMEISRRIVEEKQKNLDFNTADLQKEIDAAIYEVYDLSLSSQKHVDDFCTNIVENM